MKIRIALAIALIGCQPALPLHAHDEPKQLANPDCSTLVLPEEEALFAEGPSPAQTTAPLAKDRSRLKHILLKAGVMTLSTGTAIGLSLGLNLLPQHLAVAMSVPVGIIVGEIISPLMSSVTVPLNAKLINTSFRALNVHLEAPKIPKNSLIEFSRLYTLLNQALDHNQQYVLDHVFGPLGEARRIFTEINRGSRSEDPVERDLAHLALAEMALMFKEWRPIIPADYKPMLRLARSRFRHHQLNIEKALAYVVELESEFEPGFTENEEKIKWYRQAIEAWLARK